MLIIIIIIVIIIIIISVALIRERTIPTERPPLVGEVSTNFADRISHVGGVTNAYCRILDFLDLVNNN
jgi:hypothetical protein